MNSNQSGHEVESNSTQTEHKVESFVFYRSFYEALSGLRSGTKLALYDAICEYCLNGRIPKMPETAKPYFTLILPQLQANLKKREIGIANGSKGGRPPKNKPMGFEDENQLVSDEETNWLQTKNPNVNVNANANANVNANANDNANVNVNAQPSAPTLSEVESFARSEGIQTDIRAFFDFYNTPDSAGRTWTDTKGEPVSWRRKLRTWAALDKAGIRTERQRPAKKRNTLDNYKVDGKGIPNLEDITIDIDEL